MSVTRRVAESGAAASVAYTWGTQEAERRLPFPCDRCLDQVDAAYFRGVTVRASTATLFRWLCQMRAAPYSYDWIDNGGRRSPRTLTPGLEALAVGQSVMRIFTLVDFAKDRHLTLRITLMRWSLPWGDLVMMRRQLLNLKALAESGRGL